MELEWLRDSSCCRGLVTRRRVDPSRMADTSGRAPGSGSEGGHMRDGRREGRDEGRGVKPTPVVSWKAAGLRPTANDQV